jgi:pyruvate,orthophosphate dikinase
MSPEAVADALAAGHIDVISPCPLITMLIALRLDDDAKGLANV